MAHVGRRSLLTTMANFELSGHDLSSIGDLGKGLITGGFLSEERSPQDEMAEVARSFEAFRILVHNEDLAQMRNDWGAGSVSVQAKTEDFFGNIDDSSETFSLESAVDALEECALTIEDVKAWLIEVSVGGVEVWFDDGTVYFEVHLDGFLKEWKNSLSVKEEVAEIAGLEVMSKEFHVGLKGEGLVEEIKKDWVEWSFLSQLNGLLSSEEVEESALGD